MFSFFQLVLELTLKIIYIISGGIMKKILFLFDVNGTLLKKKEKNSIAYSETLKDMFNINKPLENIETTARSDLKVFKEFLNNHEISYTSTLYNEFLLHYKKILQYYKNQNIWERNKGSENFIKYIIKNKMDLSLFTGNLKIGAKYKLQSVNLWKYFEIGGFGEDGMTRNEIAENTVSKAQNYYNKTFDNIFVIGDTEKDIEAAKYINAKIISIANNKKDYIKLKKEKPDYLINNFEDILEIIKNDLFGE